MYTNESPIPHENSEKPTVVLRNEPKLSEHEVDQAFNTMRVEFTHHIQEFVAEHALFKNEDRVEIEFAHKGISSIVAIIETPNDKLVLKIPRSKTFSAGEGQFLQVWEDAGVDVPQVVETGEMHGYPYTLMKYVDAPTLDTKYTSEELLEKGIFLEMGKTLRRMHSQKVDGYGFVVDGKPECATVEEWLESADIQKYLEYVREYGLLKGDGGLEETLAHSLAVIRQNAAKERSTYCHTDFCPSNIFATEPITVFDANPKFNSGYYDLGRIRASQIAHGTLGKSTEQLLEGYFGEDGGSAEECDSEVLEAFTFLAFCMKSPYWHKTGRDKQIENVRKYFSQHQA